LYFHIFFIIKSYFHGYSPNEYFTINQIICHYFLKLFAIINIEVNMGELKEKIYDINTNMTDEEIKRILMPFFNDLIARKKNVLFTNDFKAIIMAFNDRCLAKVCERDGLASHNHSAINLVRYYNDDMYYYSEEDENNPYASMREKKIEKEVLRMRFASSLDSILMDIQFADTNNEFQLRVLKIAIDFFKDIKKHNIFKNCIVNLWDSKGIRIYNSQNDLEDAILDDNFNNKLIEINEERKK